MNELETALAGSNDDLNCYLENTDTQQFRDDLTELINKFTVVSAFKQKIIALIQAA